MIEGLPGLNLMLSQMERGEVTEATAKWIVLRLWTRAGERTRREIEARLRDKGLERLLG